MFKSALDLIYVFTILNPILWVYIATTIYLSIKY